MNASIGPIVAFVANGNLSVQATGAANLMRSGSDEPVTLDERATNAAADDLLLLSADAVLEVKNAGPQPSTLFVATMAVSPENGSTPTPELLGFSDPVKLQSGPMDVTITRLTLGTGATTPNYEALGPELIDIQTGSIALALNPGGFRILRRNGGMEYVNAGVYDPAAQPTFDPTDPEDLEEMEALAKRTDVPLVGAKIGLGSGDSGVLESGSLRTIRGIDAESSVVLIIAFSPTGTGWATPLP